MRINEAGLRKVLNKKHDHVHMTYDFNILKMTAIFTKVLTMTSTLFHT